jgi:hypothetical protein
MQVEEIEVKTTHKDEVKYLRYAILKQLQNGIVQNVKAY